jgi:hypothetical protein
MTSVRSSVCTECGCAGCSAIFDELLALEFEHPEPYGRLHGLTVAAYGVQHPSRFALGTRRAQWSLLRTYASQGLAAVERVQAARREANSHRRGGLPGDDHALEHAATLPSELPRGSLSIGHLVDGDSSFSPTRHAGLVHEWIVSLVS